MGLKFYVNEAQARSVLAAQLNDQAGQAIASLQSSIHLFLSAPLSSKAYDSAKNYFMIAYTPLCQSAIMTGEALERAHQKFLSDYQGSVSGIDTDEDLILEEINRLENLKRCLDQQMSTAKTPRPDLERRYMNACDVITQRQEKLAKFHAYNGHSASIFSEYQACQQEFNTGLTQVKDCKAWNPASGTFDLGKLDMSWAKPINERWNARAKELENRVKTKRRNWEKQVKADGLKLQEKLDGRKYLLVEVNGTKRWMWVVDPNRITSEDFRVNEAYDLWIKNQIELYGRDAVLGKNEPDYLTKLAIELRDGKNYDTGKPLMALEKAQRWSTIASMIAATGIAGYYANHPLTAGQGTTPKPPITGNKNGKNYILDPGKSKGNTVFKKASGLGKNIENVNPSEIRFSQTSVNGSDEIIASMKANGWKGDPIDVVRMPDGSLTTLDNTRVAAAREVGIDVQANVRSYDTPLPDQATIDRFTTKKGVPKTWGEAIELRVGKQKADFRNNNPMGSFDLEKMK
jgi:hypothetical protein